MRKKLITWLGTVLLAGILCACGSEDASSPENTGTANESHQEQTASERSQETEDASADMSAAKDLENLTHVYTENRFGYSINTLPYYNEALGYGYASYEGDMSFSEVIYITQYSGEVGNEKQLEQIDMSQYEDSTDIFDLLIGNIDDELFAGLGFTLVDYDVDILETKEINGVEMTKFEGTITTYFDSLDKNYVYPIVAYGIKSSKTPILVCCIDRTKDGSSHETWVDKIDLMISTFQDGE